MSKGYLTYSACCVVLVFGCGRSSPPKPAASQIMTSLGTNYDPVTGWNVRVDDEGDIRKAHLGWFAFAENEERVWMFDGETQLMVTVATATNWQMRIASPWLDIPVPQEVARRLPEIVRKQITPPAVNATSTN